MTNNEIAKHITDLTFNRDLQFNVCSFDQAVAISTLIEFLNNPTKYSKDNCYTNIDMEAAIVDLLKNVRIQGKHF